MSLRRDDLKWIDRIHAHIKMEKRGDKLSEVGTGGNSDREKDRFFAASFFHAELPGRKHLSLDDYVSRMFSTLNCIRVRVLISKNAPCQGIVAFHLFVSHRPSSFTLFISFFGY